MSSAAIAVLKDKEPGTFLIRDSNSFQGAYGLALKVATPPPNANFIGSKGIHLELLMFKHHCDHKGSIWFLIHYYYILSIFDLLILPSLPGDPLEQLVRHFLIETGPRGVKIKGCQNESYFGQLMWEM